MIFFKREILQAPLKVGILKEPQVHIGLTAKLRSSSSSGLQRAFKFIKPFLTHTHTLSQCSPRLYRNSYILQMGKKLRRKEGDQTGSRALPWRAEPDSSSRLWTLITSLYTSACFEHELTQNMHPKGKWIPCDHTRFILSCYCILSSKHSSGETICLHHPSYTIFPYRHKIFNLQSPLFSPQKCSNTLSALRLVPTNLNITKQLAKWQELNLQLLPSSLPGCLGNYYLLLVQSPSLQLSTVCNYQHILAMLLDARAHFPINRNTAVSKWIATEMNGCQNEFFPTSESFTTNFAAVLGD